MSNIQLDFILITIAIELAIMIMSISMMLDIARTKKRINKELEELYEAVMRIQKDRLKKAIKEVNK
jgi:signal transduction histidine kinase